MSRLTSTIADLGLQFATPEIRREANELWEQHAADLAQTLERENSRDYLLTDEAEPNKPHLIIGIIRARHASHGIEALPTFNGEARTPTVRGPRQPRPSTNGSKEPDEDGARGRCEWCRKTVHNSKLRFIQPNWLDLPVHVCAHCAKGLDEFERERKMSISAMKGVKVNAVGDSVISTFPEQQAPAEKMTGEDISSRYRAPVLKLRDLGHDLIEGVALNGGSGATVITLSKNGLEKLRSLAHKSS